MLFRSIQQGKAQWSILSITIITVPPAGRTGLQMTEVTLTNKQLKQLVRIYERLGDSVQFFVIREESKSGIGPNTYLEFSLFNEPEVDTRIDITDVEVW